LRFDGIELPPDILALNGTGWGDSILSSVWSGMRPYIDSVAGISEMIKDHTVLIHKMEGMRSKIELGHKDRLRNSFTAFRAMMKIMKAVVVDKNDELDYLVRQYTGLEGLLDKFASLLVAATDIPMTVLFGQGPQGIAAAGTGDVENEVWNTKVQEWQESKWRRPLENLLDKLWSCKESPSQGEIPDGFTFEFLPLYIQTEKEKIANYAAMAQVDSVYLQYQVLTVDEVRESRFGGPSWASDTTLDRKAWQKQQLEQQQQQLSQGGDQGQDYGQGQDFGQDQGQDQGQGQGGDYGGFSQQQDSVMQILLAADREFRQDSQFKTIWIKQKLEELKSLNRV
jgi:phage-related protein (TIGR01555 family)